MKATCIEELKTLENDGNQIIGLPAEMEKSSVSFVGKNNILFFEDGVRLHNSRITFHGNKSIVFICSGGERRTQVLVDAYHENVFYLGKNCNTTRPIHVVLSERRHIIIGDSCLFSLEVWFRNSDPHLIYSAKTKERINPTKSVYLGDHVWIGQSALVSKGTQIGSGSIVGAMAMTGGRRIPSNCAVGGVPANVISRDIFWDKQSVHAFRYAQTQESMQYDSDEFIYEKDSTTLRFDDIDRGINQIKDMNERLEYLKKTLYENTDKNRFFIANVKKSKTKKLIAKLKKIIKKILKK